MSVAFSALPVYCRADIYRFVTIDGVETFTDAPQDKKAKVVIKEYGPAPSKNKKTAKNEKVREVSLNDIVEKTVRASLNPREMSPATFEPHLPKVGGTITSGVGMRIDPIDGKLRHHNGIDIAIPEGTPVKAVAPGVVVYSGLRSGYGYTVLIEHDNGMITIYGHNSRLLVAQGQPVDTETTIALSGNTGRSTGPHLHFEAWQAGVNVTPAFMPGSTTSLPKIQSASSKHRVHFRKTILADGSVLFTNIPDSVP
ncbi:MAG: M23 family metallopeptidase [Oryzomonas sp.]|uniref:M23 family metallopeptidase n=1 Tax=Oryzomonas sp. TaxID=2855186 RepID=UPI0028522FFC|nr:M23 family metallopeptidase [Oryzomonas sp.]MDR3578885.1 M23 family metallopeptidase [Oryzomonas sp.]